MSSPLSPRLRRTLWCVPVLAAAACSVDAQRDLAYGVGMTSGSASSLTEGGRENDGGSGESGHAGLATGGAPDDAGGAGGRSGVVAGAPGSDAGAPASGAPGSSGSAGSNAASGSGGGAGHAVAGNGGSGAGGTSAGSSGTGGKPDDSRCGDLDQNGVQDCEETLAKNAAFDANVEQWVADPGVTKAWRLDEARDGMPSGGLSVTFTSSGGSSGWALGAVGQCLPAWTDDVFEVGARCLVPGDQGGGSAQVSLAIFAEDDCKGSLLESKTPVLSTQIGSWRALHSSVKMPAGTRSVLVRLAAAKPGPQASLEVHFDDILFRKK
jgi:hypothetical protein